MSKTTKPLKPDAAATRASAPACTGIADALFSATQQRVLALLFGQPGRSFFTNELIGLVGAGSGAVQREVRRLVESGLVTVTRLGSQKHYQANPAAPIFEELRGIVTKTLGSAEVLRAALLPLGDTVRLALLYGSVAKGSDTAHSDIDLLLVSDALTLEQVYTALTLVEQQLGRRVSPTLYSVAEFRRRRAGNNPFLTKVLAGATIRLTEDRDDLLAAG
ncbi:nucleotidyltransferase domain-containing protein [Sulfuriferula sp.]|uniref:nucleotidyltransferase domain-containing protein n=1 Tax=Sulfuriferula sp. TaxID=2025307 RepID=UPI002730F930|nr:nucleotidyltransferase domain-containing protein [Sulfuriferula sp.]MDP2025518.1 nucleotidyltransferase domain-containing protein [Sulfuriferula sp.]